MNARAWNTSTASAPVDEPAAFDELVGSEEFGNKFVADYAQTFYELLDYQDGPLGDAAIVRAVRKLTACRDAEAHKQLDRIANENIYAAREFNREALEDR